LLIVVVSGGQSHCYRRWCRRLSSRLPSLVGCFHCPPPPTLAASHGRRHTSSPVRYPHSRRFNITVVVAGSSSRCRDTIGGGTTRDCRDADVRLHFIVVLVVLAIPPPSPQSRASTAPIAR
jgi:hypothetical protein